MEMHAERIALDKVYKRRDRYEIPDWQREKVWPKEKKQMLIDSILREWKLPKFYFVKLSSDPGEYEVVDGQQRLMAIFDFFDNELNLNSTSAHQFAGEYYKDLPEHISDRFDDYEIEFDEITDAGEEELKQFFQRLQDGLPLTGSEKLNSVHSNLRNFARKLSKHPFFTDKVTASDKRYGHFDIVSKVAAIEIEGIDIGIRYDDLKTIFESQASFSARSNVAHRLHATFDYLNNVFPKSTSILRNRTIVQSVATLAARLIQTGKHKGTEARLLRFFDFFIDELSKQVTLGHQGTDLEFIQFQKTVNANVRRSAQIRNEILLRKLLMFDPGIAEVFGVNVVAESAMEQSLVDAAERIRQLIEVKNEEYSRDTGEDLFKATNRTANALATLGQPIKSYQDYRNWIDKLYFVFHESAGTRLYGKWPPTFADVNTLRTAEQHDVDHGKAGKVAIKRRQMGAIFRKYSSVTTPATLAPERFVVAQARLLAELEKDLRTLKWQ